MKSLVHMEELCSRSVPLEHAPGANPACVSAFILTGSHHAQALPVPLVPVHLNSSASVNLRRNSLSIYL